MLPLELKPHCPCAPSIWFDIHQCCNDTSEVPDVFHQLHCLVSQFTALRTFLRCYKPTIRQDLLEFEHLNHCVDSIRQSLMCTSDISVNVWQWSEHYKVVAGRVNVAHSCRNFDKIKQWVRGRLAPEHPMDKHEYVENDLPFPPIYNSAAE
ncbi:hypothetical protein BD626DRAFT_398710 [Schizophyllum amplum]|uniref:Uncharacterized protein n=1 Tax=Schizophyllum amplum TaxID=97359 RepID=A0A550CKR8_9AGAR|nr:hypothetical protein BD626DRAFT_398710 [Auriculariopsis ampla]